MYKIGIIGQRERVMCFMAAGFSIYEAADALQAADSLKAAKNDGCAVIYIVPSVAQLIPEEIAKYSGETVPAIIPLPEAGGGYGITQLKSAVERAVGADIIFKEQ